MTLRLFTYPEWHLIGAGLIFLVAAGVVLQSLASANASFREVLNARVEMDNLLHALKQSEDHYRYSVETNPQIPWISDPSGSLTELSPRWGELSGRSSSEGLGWGWISALHPDDVGPVRDHWQNALATNGERKADIRYRLHLADGRYRWFRARAYPRFDADGAVKAWYGTLEDIHDQVAAERALQISEERYRLASLATNDIIWDFSLKQDHISWSNSAVSILGYPETIKGTTKEWMFALIHPADRNHVRAGIRQLLVTNNSNWLQEFRVLSADGTYLNFALRAYVVRDSNGSAVRIIGSLQNVTSQKEYEQKLEWAARFDPLTNLPNRSKFSEKLQEAIDHAALRDRIALLIVIDVDRFKHINDQLGHDAGDALLQEIASRLQAAVPLSATVARLGGDEFAAIIPNLKASDNPASLAENIISRLAGPFHFNGRQLDVSLSAGAAIALMDGKTPDELHKSADLALYAAKKHGPGELRCFKKSYREEAALETQMLAHARSALGDGQIIPYYQPKVSFRTGECTGFEALLRWNYQGRDRLPGEISAALEDPGLSVQITDAMLDRVILDMQRWADAGHSFGRISVNGASGDFRAGDFDERILSRLARAGLPPSTIELEVTENVFLSRHAKNVEKILETLSKEGVTITLDDFGTGYASLIHLKQYPVDIVKIDRSFITRLDSGGTEDNAIVDAVIELARKLEIATVAEGVETVHQASLLALRGCDLGQGFLFGHPQPAARVPDLLSKWNRNDVVDLFSM